MPLAEIDKQTLPFLLSLGIFTASLVLLAALFFVYFYLLESASARKTMFFVLLASGFSVFLALLYALAPALLPTFPYLGVFFILLCITSYFALLFCPRCGRPSDRYRLVFTPTHCPFCGQPFHDSSPFDGLA